MGVPQKPNKTWMKKLNDYINDHACNVKDLEEDDNRVARIAYDQKKNICTQNLKSYKPVYKIPIKYLKFNAYSARLGQFSAVAQTLDQNKTTEFKLIQKELIRRQSGKFFKKLKKEGQEKVVVAMADGVLIDGNRRMANHMEINVDYLYVVILPENLPEQEAADMEAYYSDQDDGSEIYDPVDRGRQMHEYKKKWGSFEGMLEILPAETETTLQKQADAYLVAREYAKLKKWPKKYNAIDVDRITDGTKGGPGFDWCSRIVTKLPTGNTKAQKKQRADLLLAVFTIVRGTFEQKLGRLDTVLDNFFKNIKTAKNKAKFLKDCPLYKTGGAKKWNTNEMYNKVQTTAASVRISGGRSSSGSTVWIKEARDRLDKCKKSELKINDTTTEERLKEIKTQAITLLEKYKKKT